MAPDVVSRKKKRETSEEKTNYSPRKNTPSKTKAPPKKASLELNSIASFQGKKLPLKSTISDVVIRFETKQISEWGVLCDENALRLCVETEDLVSMLPNPKIIGCVFEENLGLKDCPEGLVLLTEDENQEGEETSKISYCFSRDGYELFDQIYTERNFNMTLEQIWDDECPRAPAEANGPNIEKYIQSILMWLGQPSCEGFRVGKKETLEKDAKFASGNLPKVITAENIGELCNSFSETYKQANIFDSKVFKIENSMCRIAPNLVKYREHDPDYSRDLANSMKFRSLINFEKRVCFLIPMKWDDSRKDEKGYHGTPLSQTPTSRDLPNCHFWIIGGQHTIMAYRLLINDPEVDEEIREQCRTVDAVMFWAPPNTNGNLVMMGLSKTLNHVHHTAMVECQFFLIARHVRDIWISWGRPKPETNSIKDSKWKFFVQAAKIVVPWAKEEKGTLRFLELGPFIFNMSDETFQLWMKVYEQSRIGNLVAFNGFLQKDVIRLDSTCGAWAVSRRTLRDLQGVEDEVLNEIAHYLLDQEKVSLMKNRKSAVAKKTEAGPFEGVFLSLEDYCVREKHNKEFEILLLEHVAKEKLSKTELRALKREERKSKVQAMMTLFKMDLERIELLRGALGDTVVSKSLMKNYNDEKLPVLIPPAFSSLVTDIRATVDDHEEEVVREDGEFRLCSIPGFGNPRLMEQIVEKLRNEASFIFMDATMITGEKRGIEFYDVFFRASARLGKRPSHVVVVISSAVESFSVMNAIFRHGQYVAFTTHYMAKSPPSSMTNTIYAENCYFVTHAFYNEKFEKDLELKQDELLETVASCFTRPGRLENYQETYLDVLQPTLAGEKSERFYNMLCSHFVSSGQRAICFGPIGLVAESLLKLGARVFSYDDRFFH